jgi:predicted nucleic acid-binding protein
LRDNITADDGMYVAFAEAIEALIETCDSPFAKAARPTFSEGFPLFRLSPSPR